MENLLLPLGIESFSELRESNYYYIDKTSFIETLLQKTFKVNLITRPRRFGKTLTMSMLADFLDLQKNSRHLFKDLAVFKNQPLCSLWMNQWPVLFFSLKNVEGLNFESAMGLLRKTISDICKEHSYLGSSESVDNDDKNIFLKLKAEEADETQLKSSLYTLMRMMNDHFKKAVILLIDEYDVPLANSSENGYYPQMLDCLRAMLGMVLKSNRFLKFAVITGCLRIAKESIFTGTNNFVSDTITGKRFDEYFGFTENEVLKLLQDTGFSARSNEVKNWYNGYHFGSHNVYCPWDVLQFVNELQDNPSAWPKSYWKNTSHNGIIRSFIDRTDLDIHRKFEALMSGSSVAVTVCEDLTYDLLHSSEDNLWSILYLTGYLTPDMTQPAAGENQYFLKIPNEEIRGIFAETISQWFSDGIRKLDRSQLFEAVWQGDDLRITRELSNILFNTISYYDYHENFYHAFLAGIFSGSGYYVESNREYGTGRPDIVITDSSHRRAAIIEVKHCKTKDQLSQKCDEALKQINAKDYSQSFLSGYQTVILYGIAFFQKQCLVKGQKEPGLL